jgi:hypothetical protein
MPWNQEEILERSKLRKSVMGLSPDEGGSVVRKLSTIKEHHQDQSCCFSGEITGTGATTPKICPGFESR